MICEFELNASLQAFEKAQYLIPEGIKGMHKIYTIGEYPAYFAKGQGPYVWDIDGNKYIDTIMGKGPYILGYCHPEVDSAVIEQIHKGNVFPMGNLLHSSLAEKLIEVIPSAERVLFYKTGTCATSAAVRLARIYTGRNVIFSSGYHGWQDWSYKYPGTPAVTWDYYWDFGYSLNKLEALLEKYGQDGAAVIVTPEDGYFTKEYYIELIDICRKHEVLFILDEVKSGFRSSLGGFQEKYGITPDLSIFSKAMSNGYSISALVGRKEVVETGRLTHTAGTYDTEVIPFAAAPAAINVLERDKVLGKIEKAGRSLEKGFESIFTQHGLGIHPVFAGGSIRFWFRDHEMERIFYVEMAKRGVLFYTYDNSNLSFSHDALVIGNILDAAESVVKGHLAGYKGTWQPFTINDIGGKVKNKKGFFSEYPGPNGRA